MTIISAKKDNKIYFGCVSKMSTLINVTPSTIFRWIKEKEKVVYKNGFEVYLETEEIK